MVRHGGARRLRGAVIASRTRDRARDSSTIERRGLSAVRQAWVRGVVETEPPELPDLSGAAEAGVLASGTAVAAVAEAEAAVDWAETSIAGKALR